MNEICKILVVDDEEECLELLSRQLSRMGYAPATAASGERALTMLDTEDFEVAMLDLCMPGMDGLTLLRKIQDNHINTVPVIFSGRRSIASAVEAMKCGAFDYIEKDGDVDVLRATIARAIEHGRLKRHAKEMSEAAQALKKSNMEMERLVDSMSSFLVEVDAGRRVCRWNAAAERIFGIPASQVLGRPFRESGILWDWDDFAPDFSPWLMADETIYLVDRRYTQPDGTEGLLAATVNAIRDEERAPIGFFLLGADITERRVMESQLLQAQKLESIGRLAAGIAHEINTPTQYVGDNIEFLQTAFEELGKLHGAYRKLLEPGTGEKELVAAREDIDDTDVEFLNTQIPRAISQTLEGVGRIASIVRAMKEFSHPGTEEKEPMDLNHLIESTITVSRNEWKYVADVETHFDATLPCVPCLPGEFNQAVLNILVNAAHAIGDALGEGSLEKGVITVSTCQDDGWAEIRISDTGPGIPQEIADHIFDPFFTTKEVGRGTGQGLAISRNVIIEEHHGSLYFETELGKGTTFIIRLPLHEVQCDD